MQDDVLSHLRNRLVEAIGDRQTVGELGLLQSVHRGHAGREYQRGDVARQFLELVVASHKIRLTEQLGISKLAHFTLPPRTPSSQ